MLKDLQWFLDRESSYIMQNKTEVFIGSEEKARELYAMQSPDCVFSDKLRIHRKPPEGCVSCEA